MSMPRSSRSGDGRHRRERGAAALEFGLVSPIVFAVLFGTLTYGLWFNDSLNLRQGLREASRQGVVANYGTETCTMDYNGTTPSANIKKLMCRAQSDIGAMTGETYVKVLLTPAGWVRGQELVVCGMVQADRLPGLVPLPGDRMIRWSSRMSIETATPAQAANPANTLEREGRRGEAPAGDGLELVRLTARLRTRHDDERGAVVVLVAAMTVVIFGVAALVVDLGQARVVRRDAQAASDSSALAAANALYLGGTATPDIDGAVQAAKKYAADNYGVTEADWATCQDPHPLGRTGRHAPSASPSTTPIKPSTVRVGRAGAVGRSWFSGRCSAPTRSTSPRRRRPR